jgi:hypothetical protein
MPRIEIRSETEGHKTKVMLSEHVPAGMLSDDHYADQLVERMGWAIVDAERVEQEVT